MSRFFNFLSVSFLSYCVLFSCSSNDVPQPVDCSVTDLTITVVDTNNPASCGSNDGSIEVTASGGKSGYTYSINGGPFSAESFFDGLGNGIFKITVRDKTECTKFVEVGLSSGDAPNVTSSIENDAQCLPPHDGSITMNATGGTGPYMYKLNNGSYSANSTFLNVKAGTYNVTVKDGANCEVVVSTTVGKDITGVDYDGDILPVFEVRCKHSGCHPANGDWFTYSVAKANALKIKTQTSTRRMPKDPQPGGDLTENELALITCWVNDGAPKNN